MSFSKHIYQSFAWRFFYYAIVLLLNIAIACYFEASLSGWFNYLVSIGSLIVLISGLSLDSAIGYFSARENADLSFWGRFIFSWCTLIALVTVLAGFLLKYNNLFPGNVLLVITCTLYVAGNLFINFTQAVLLAKYDFRTPGLINILFNTVLIVLLIISAMLDYKLDISSFLAVYSSSILIQGIVLWLFMRKKYKINFGVSFSFAAAKPLFNYALVAFAGNLIFFLVYRIDYWFVHHYCDDVLLGNYIQVSKLAQLFLVIPSAIAAVIFPAAAKGQVDIGTKLKMLSRILVTCFLVVLAFLAITGKWLFPWLFGSSFDKMYTTFLLLIPGILSLVIISLLGAYFAGKDLVRINLIGAFLAFIVIIIADLLLIPTLQIKGAAIACSISYTVYLIYLLAWFSRKEHTNIYGMLIINRGDIDSLKYRLNMSKQNETVTLNDLKKE